MLDQQVKIVSLVNCHITMKVQQNNAFKIALQNNLNLVLQLSSVLVAIPLVWNVQETKVINA